MEKQEESIPLPYPFCRLNYTQIRYVAPVMKQICDAQYYVDLLISENPRMNDIHKNELTEISTDLQDLHTNLDETNKTLNEIRSALGKMENALALFRRCYYHDISKEDYDQLLDFDDQIFDLEEQSRKNETRFEELVLTFYLKERTGRYNKT